MKFLKKKLDPSFYKEISPLALKIGIWLRRVDKT